MRRGSASAAPEARPSASARSHSILGEARKNKLTARQYDEATWATRSFGVFVEQQIAVALLVGVAAEILQACGGGVYGIDLRPRRGVAARA